MEKTSLESFNKPDPVFADKIMLNGQYYSKNQNERKDIHTILYYVDKNNPLSSDLFEQNKDPQFKNWEWAVRNYYNLPD